MTPPSTIDDAEVLYWAWSEPAPFFVMTDSNGEDAVAIHGLALCRYPDSKVIYRFSCNSSWETENDSTFETVQQAMQARSAQYDVSSVGWLAYEPHGGPTA